MYRSVDRNALFQGDLLVVPDVSIRDPDPRIIFKDQRQLVCGTCGKPAPEPRECPDPKCRAQFSAVGGRIRSMGLGLLQAKGEDPLVRKTEVLAKFGSRMAIVNSHSCDIDQQGEICLLGIRPLRTLGESTRDALERDGRINNFFYLAPSGLMPAAAVELNNQFSLPVSWFGEKQTYSSPKKKGHEEHALVPFDQVVAQRMGSLSRDGMINFYEAQLQHISRSPLELQMPSDFELEEIEAERPNPMELPKRKWRIPNPNWLLQSLPTDQVKESA